MPPLPDISDPATFEVVSQTSTSVAIAVQNEIRSRLLKSLSEISLLRTDNNEPILSKDETSKIVLQLTG
jgi:hypothetical protein